MVFCLSFFACLSAPAALQPINLGAAPNDGTGDGLRTAFTKVNTNDAQLDAKKLESTNGVSRNLTIHGGNTAITFTNLADLLASGETNKVLHALGHSTLGDTGGGEFYYDPASAEATNRGTIFTASAGGRYKRRFTDTVNVDWFGAKGDGATIDTVPIQSAINFALSNKVGRVVFTAGKSYLVDDLLIIGATNSSGVWQFRGNITLSSGSAHNLGDTPINQGAKITQTSSNLALFALQHVRGVTIESLNLEGKNAFAAPVTSAAMLKWTNYVVAPVSTNRYSGHTAIIIDPFWSTVNNTNRYAGHTNDYTVTSGGSVQVIIRGNTFRYWFKAIDVAGAQNGDSIQIEKNQISECTFALTTGNSQARGCTFNDNLMSGIWLMFTTKFSGDGIGVAPSFRGNEGSGITRLFDVEVNRGPFNFSDGYFESILSIGVVGSGSDPGGVTFTGGFFGHTSDVPGGQDADAFFYSSRARVVFNGVSFGADPVRFYTAHNSANTFKDGRITFVNCSFKGNAANGMTNGFACNDPSQIRLINTSLEIDNNSGAMTAFSDRVAVGAASGNPDTFDGQMVWPGTHLQRGPTNYFVPPDFFTFGVGGTVRFNGDGTGTVSNLTSLVRVKIGDQLYSDSGHTWSNATAPFNLSNPIAGQNLFNFGTVYGLSNSMVYFNSSPYDLATAANVTIGVLQRYKMHAYTTGAIESGANTITNVSPISSWSIGDRVRGDGITDGTIVTNITGTTLQLSASSFPARAAPLLSEIYEARLVQLNTGADALITASPSGGTAAPIKFGGKEISLVITANLTNAVRVEIGGTKYWLLLANETP